MGRFLHVVLFLVVLATRLALCFGAVCSSLEACSPSTTNELELAGCYRFCDPWKDTPLYCACINNTVPVCLGCIPYMQEFSGFYESEYSCSKCSACSSWGSTQFASLWCYQQQNCELSSGNWLYKYNEEPFCVCTAERGGADCSLARKDEYCEPGQLYDGGCVDSSASFCDPHEQCTGNSGVCFMDQSTNILCPGVIASDGVGGSTGGDDSSEISDSSSSSPASGSSSPDVDESCVSIDCLPDVQRCTSNQYRCLDGSCVNDRSKCSNNGIAPSPVRPVEDTVDNTKDSSITFTALSGDENNQNRTLGSLQVKNGTFAAPTVISVSPASFAKLYELLGKNFTRSILSSVVSLRAFFAEDNDGVGAELSEGDFLQPVLISLIVDQVVSEGEACMAFLDETEKVWRCLADTTVTTVDDFTSSFSAFTPHFTDFAVLLAEDTSDGEDDGDGDDGTLEDGVVDETAKNEDKEEDETDIGPIVGGTVGGVVFLVVIFFVGVALVWYIRKRLQERGTSSDFQSKVVNFGMDEDDDLSL